MFLQKDCGGSEEHPRLDWYQKVIDLLFVAVHLLLVMVDGTGLIPEIQLSSSLVDFLPRIPG